MATRWWQIGHVVGTGGRDDLVGGFDSGAVAAVQRRDRKGGGRGLGHPASVSARGDPRHRFSRLIVRRPTIRRMERILVPYHHSERYPVDEFSGSPDRVVTTDAEPAD